MNKKQVSWIASDKLKNILVELVNSVEKDLGVQQLTLASLAIEEAASKLEALLTTERQELLDLVEKEVIGKDEIEGHSPWLRDQVRVINRIKEMQRKAIQSLQVKETKR